MLTLYPPIIVFAIFLSIKYHRKFLVSFTSLLVVRSLIIFLKNVQPAGFTLPGNMVLIMPYQIEAHKQGVKTKALSIDGTPQVVFRENIA